MTAPTVHVELNPRELDLLVHVLALAKKANWGQVPYRPTDLDPLRRKLQALVPDSYH